LIAGKTAKETKNMSRYAKATLNAVKRIENGETPPLAWENATVELFGKGSSFQRRGCQKGAFLGLCEEGCVKGVPKGSYLATRAANKNKQYALAALKLLKQEQAIPEDWRAFWQKVPGTTKSMNGQLDVLFVLAEAGYIDWRSPQ
jgi:hypothetical protein